MIGNIYSKSDMHPHRIDDVPTSELLAVTNTSDVQIELTTYYEREEWLTATLPFGTVAKGGLIKPSDSYPGSLYLDYIKVGDERLIGTGAGARLLTAFAAFALERCPEVTELRTGWARLGLVNALVKAFGEDSVQVRKGGAEMIYGRGSSKSVEQMLVEHPPVEGEAYMVPNTSSLLVVGDND